MFEYEFFDRSLMPGEVPPAGEPVPGDFIPADSIEGIRPTWWREHCVECSEPLCFSTCKLYSARADGKCRRFRFGLRDNPDPAFADCLHHVEVDFLPWGKLETVVYPRVTTVERARELDDARERLCEDVLADYARDPESFDEPRWASIFPDDHVLAFPLEDEPATQTETFLFQVFSHNAEPYRLTFEVTTLDTLVLRRSLEVEPGYNQFVLDVPVDVAARLDDNLPENVLIARIVPQDDFRAHMTVLAADFVTLKSADREVKVPDAPARKVKCVCWDLDNTVWDGTLVETDPATLALRPGVRDAMDELDRRGIVQVVVSKNDELAVRPVLERLGILDMFVYILANWSPKSSNVRHAAQLLNIGLDTFAMVDDQPYERAEISEALPCVRTYEETAVPALLDEAPFDVPVTDESRARRAMYQEESRRHDVAASFAGNNLEFLKSCQMSFRLENPTTPAQRHRSFELVQRTNQLNLSGHRYDEEGFLADLERLGSQVMTATCGDRFGTYGQILHFVVDAAGDTLYVREFAMSCRVMGKGVERALLSWIMDRARAAGYAHVVFKGVRTERNGLLVSSFSKAGMSDVALNDDEIVLEVSTDDVLPDTAYIQIADDVAPWPAAMAPFARDSALEGRAALVLADDPSHLPLVGPVIEHAQKDLFLLLPARREGDHAAREGVERVLAAFGAAGDSWSCLDGDGELPQRALDFLRRYPEAVAVVASGTDALAAARRAFAEGRVAGVAVVAGVEGGHDAAAGREAAGTKPVTCAVLLDQLGSYEGHVREHARSLVAAHEVPGVGTWPAACTLALEGGVMGVASTGMADLAAAYEGMAARARELALANNGLADQLARAEATARDASRRADEATADAATVRASTSFRFGYAALAPMRHLKLALRNRNR